MHRDQKQGTGVCGATTQERFFVGFKPYSCHVAEASGDSSKARGCSLRV